MLTLQLLPVNKHNTNAMMIKYENFNHTNYLTVSHIVYFKVHCYIIISHFGLIKYHSRQFNPIKEMSKSATGKKKEKRKLYLT